MPHFHEANGNHLCNYPRLGEGKTFKTGGADGTRTRGLLRDRQAL